MKRKPLVDCVNEAILDAGRYLGGSMESSARACLEDAVKQRDAGNNLDALAWAVRSLKYSVGINSITYTQHARAAYHWGWR